MDPLRLLVPVLAGVLLALPYAAHARRTRAPRLLFAVGLVVAALIYVLFALVAGELRAALVETGGVLVFAVPAVLGLRAWAQWLAVGWAAHVAWDVLLHPLGAAGYAPWWYPPLCIGFDLFVAGFIAATFWRGGRGSLAGSSALEPAPERQRK